MKKFIYFAAAVSLGALLAGCAKNEAVVSAPDAPDQLICFDAPVVGVPTKGNAGYQTTDPHFRVFGRVHNQTYNGWTDNGTYKIGDYMDTEVAYNGSAYPATWYPTPYDYYWPKNSNWKLSFLAFSPYMTDAQGGKFTDTGITFTDYVVPGNVDLLYSKMTYNQTGPGSGTTTTPLPATDPAYEGVNIQFQHALSSIVFNVKTAADFSATAKIYITGITLSSVSSKGSFNQNLDTSTAEASAVVGGTQSPAWEAADPVVNAEYTHHVGPQEVGTSPLSVGSQTIVLPQNLTDNVQKATITYTTQSKIGVDAEGEAIFGIAVPSTSDVYFYSCTPDKIWEIGKQYIYTIIIGLKRIYFAPEVVNWESGTTTNIEI